MPKDQTLDDEQNDDSDLVDDVTDLTARNIDSVKVGGWLLVFKIINLLHVVASPIVLLLLITLVLLDPSELDIALGLTVLELIPNFVFSFLILRKLKLVDLNIPEKIKSLMGYSLFFNFVVYLIFYSAYKQGLVSDKPYPILLSVIYYFIWATYFKKSKRVKARYGQNA